MLSVYQEMIMEATGVHMPDELAEIEDIMRGESGTLNGLSKEEFVELAVDAKAANDAIRNIAGLLNREAS